jgi:signal transduction histidine kinase
VCSSDLRIASTPGQGATFTVELPLLAEAVIPPAA